MDKRRINRQRLLPTDRAQKPSIAPRRPDFPTLLPSNRPMIRARFLPRKLLLVAALAAAFASEAAAKLMINGTGASFPQPMYVRWFEKYSEVDATFQFSYVGVGSLGGRTLMLKGSTDFAASDVPIADEALAGSERTIWHLPSVASAVAVCHNLKGYPDLQLDGPTVAKIFLGKITKWNDPAIAALNPGTPLPGRDIVVIHPTEHGTLSEIFSSYLRTVSPEWAEHTAKGGEIAWPEGPGAYGNAGVAKLVHETPSSIAYLELSVAKRWNFRIVALRNPAGNFVRPSAETVMEAFATIPMPEDMRFSLINAPGKNAYPVGIVSWLLVDPKLKSERKTKKLKAFLDWVYSEGEPMAPSVGLVSLPPSVCERIRKRLEAM